MNLMDLFVKVAYDDSDVDKGIEGTSKKGSSFAKGLGTAFRTVAVGVGAIAGAAGAGAIALGKAVISSFGELEQNLGGAEAVFGAYADSIVSSSADAYKKIGLSQSEYLAAANKMGALFQGSGLDQQRSLEMTTSAMQRAADMASVMGIDGKAAMDAVTGAAKGNYTMMDNLGVAMNDTSLQAYALAKGLDVTWESATQAQKAELAMQMFLENTAQYAGNFEREATQTISGSLGMLKASISDFVAGMGDADADTAQLAGNIVSSFESVIKNVSPVLKNIVKAAPPALSAIVSAVGDMLPELLSSVSDLFGSVLTTIIGLLPTLVPAAAGAITTIINTLIENLPLLIEAALTILTTLALGIAEQAPTLIPAIVTAIMTIINTLISNIPLLVSAAIQLVQGLANGVLEAIPLLVEMIPTLITSLIDAIITAVPMLLEAAVSIVMGLVDGIVAAIPLLVEMIPTLIEQLITALMNAIPLILQAAPKIILGLVNGIVAAIPLLVGMVPQLIQSVVVGIIENLPMLITAAIQMVIQLAVGLVQAIPELIKAIPELIKALVEGFGAMMGELGPIGLNLVKGIFNGISNAVSWLYGKLKGWVNSVLSYIKGLFGIKSPSTVMREGVGKMLAFGLGDGIMKYAGYATDAMAGLMDGIMGETYNPVINPSVNGSTGLYGDALATAGGMGGVNIGQVNFNQPLHSTTQAARLFARKLTGELYA